MRTRSLDPDRVAVDPQPVHVRVTALGVEVADSRRALVVREVGHPPRYYLPPEDVRIELLQRTDDGASCPWKGDWRHLDLRVNGKTLVHAAWTYYRTLDDGPQIRDHIAFYPDKVTLAVGD